MEHWPNSRPYMLLDARSPDEVPADITGTTVIVGAGTIGLFMATILARNNKPIILVEAGGLLASKSNNSESAESVGKPHDGVLNGRAAGLGGTSVLWGGQLAEFDEADLTRPGSEWPIQYEELRRWYDHVYDMLGVAGRRSTEDYRHFLGGETLRHQNIERFFTLWLPQPNFALLFRRAITSSPLIRIVLNATVNDIAFDGTRAKAVIATTQGGRRVRIGAENFIFSAGTIANSRFFLTSQRLSAVPWKKNNLVGKYFQDHLGGKIADVEITNEQRFRTFFENGFVSGLKLQPKLRFVPKARAGVASGVCGMFAFNSELSDHVANIKRLAAELKSGVAGFSGLRTLPSDILALNRSFGPLILRYVLHRRVHAFFERGVEFHAQAEQMPVIHSRIVLLNGALASDGLFRVGVNWQVHGGEVETVSRFASESNAYLEALGLARLRIDPALRQGNSTFLEHLNDTAHQCGGLRLATSPSVGVTDSDCRIWGTANVFVAGSSVFPTSSHANCTLTAFALAARLAHKLAQNALGCVPQM
jgi:choline dehydrogenase-like flavoprotein